MFRSLRGRLITLLLLLFAASIAAGALMLGLFRQSATAQAGQADAEIGRACDAIIGAYRFYIAAWQGPAPGPDDAVLRRDLTTVVQTVVMLPISLLAGQGADRWGRKPIFLVAFAVLPLRALLYTLSDRSAWLIAVQLLDGVGAGIFGVLMPLVVADLMRGTGRYNLALGAVGTVQGIGASLSGLAVGLIVDHLGYGIAFLTSAIVASVALVVFVLAMPETAPCTTWEHRRCVRYAGVSGSRR